LKDKNLYKIQIIFSIVCKKRKEKKRKEKKKKKKKTLDSVGFAKSFP